MLFVHMCVLFFTGLRQMTSPDSVPHDPHTSGKADRTDVNRGSTMDYNEKILCHNDLGQCSLKRAELVFLSGNNVTALLLFLLLAK